MCVCVCVCICVYICVYLCVYNNICVPVEELDHVFFVAALPQARAGLANNNLAR